MDFKLKFGENYILLAALRQYIEHGVMLSSVYFWRDSFQDFQELRAVDRRSKVIKTNQSFEENDFLISFVTGFTPTTIKKNPKKTGAVHRTSDGFLPTVVRTMARNRSINFL